jgi:hypothetical protein
MLLTLLLLATGWLGTCGVCRGTEKDAADLAAFFLDAASEDNLASREPRQLSVEGDAPLPRPRSDRGATEKSGPLVGSELPDFTKIAKRAGLFLLGMCTVCGLTMLLGGSRRRKTNSLQDENLGVAGTLTVGPGIGLKVVQVGRQRIVIGYDRSGMRDMVVLPEPFTSMLDDSEMEPRALHMPRDSYRPALAQMLTNPKDSGWELNRTIPPR